MELAISALEVDNEELLRFNKDFAKTLNEKRSFESKNSKLLSKINDLEFEVMKLVNDKEVCLKCNLLPDDWSVDSGCTKHVTGNRILFTSYKACVQSLLWSKSIFGEKPKGQGIGGDNSMLWHRRLGHANMRESSLPEPKLSPSVEDDRINEPIVQDLNGSPSLQVNVSDEGYPKSIKEARDHLIEQVIGELNVMTLRIEKKRKEKKRKEKSFMQ
ncbi:hypothetical protein Tco_0994128, partial [Tanacetum coccineum]